MNLVVSSAVGFVVSFVEEILKNPAVKWIPAEKYPKLTQWILCLGAVIGYLLWQKGLSLANWEVAIENLVKVLATSFVAYKTLIEQK